MSQESLETIKVSEANCQLAVNPMWPINIDFEPLQGSLSQHVPGIKNSAIFLHYGPESTISSYIGAWKNRYGDLASVREDKEVLQHGLRGRRVQLEIDEQVTEAAMIPVEGGTDIAPELDITPAQILVCIGYTVRQVPVLVGYLFPQKTDKRYIAAAERIISSLQLLD